MPYTTPTEVEMDFKDSTFSTGKNISDTDVLGYIVESDALINSYVGARYTVPVTAGDGLNLLKFFSRCLVTARIKRVLEVKQDKSGDANQNIVGTLLTPQQVIKELEKIRDGDLDLAGAELLASAGGFYNKNVAVCAEPVVKKDERQW